MRASLLAALTIVFAFATAVRADDPFKEKSYEKQIVLTIKYNYLLYLPEGYEKSEERFPLVLFLHGAGETGTDTAKLKKEGLPKLVTKGKTFPFILVAPQSQGMGWNSEALGGLLDEVASKYRVDPDRVYVTGLSMGGGGTIALAREFPERFAAMAPICAAMFRSPGSRESTVEKLKGIPAWYFHGGKDPVVPVSGSEQLVKALKDAGADVKLTIYPEAGHDSWTEAYDTPELYEWLLSHRRKAK